MKQIRATTPGDAFWTLDPFALVGPKDLWYCDIESRFDPARYGLVHQLRRRLTPQSAGPEFVHIGVVGHGGTGKTTQVRKAMHDLSGHNVTAFFVDALGALDQTSLSFADMMLVIANAVTSGLSELGVAIPEKTSELVKLWFAEELLSETHRKEILGTVEAEAAASGGIPFLAKLMTKVTAVLRSDNEYRKEIRRRAERDSVELVRRVNTLLDAAADALNGRKVAIVVDNLEKLTDRRQVDAAVLRRADEMRQLRCHLVFFFAPADQYAPSTIQASQAFDVVTLPMLPIRERSDSPDHVAAPALATVKEVLDKRVDITQVFEEPDRCIYEAARLSGGRLRDVFHLSRLACELADPGKVKPQHLQAAARKLKGERSTMTKSRQWRRLAEIHRDKQVANDEDDAHLLLHLLVLNYDGEPWWDVHPLVRLDERFKESWQSLSSIAT